MAEVSEGRCCCSPPSSSSASSSASSASQGPLGCCSEAELPATVVLTLSVLSGPSDCACLGFSGAEAPKGGTVLNRSYQTGTVAECDNSNQYTLTCGSGTGNKWSLSGMTQSCVVGGSWVLVAQSCSPFQLEFILDTTVLNQTGCRDCNSHAGEAITLKMTVVRKV